MLGRILFSALVFVTLLSCSQTSNSTSEIPVEKPTTLPQEECIHMNEVKYSKGMAYQNDSPLTGKVCSYHSNGNTHTLSTYENGIKQGLWEVFYADGKREKSGFTRNGSDDGLYREWYPNGNLKYEYHYDLGKKIDIWKSWYEDGTRYTERHFMDDKLNGKVLVWDERGKLAKEYDYVDGILINSIMHFKEPGF